MPERAEPGRLRRRPFRGNNGPFTITDGDMRQTWTAGLGFGTLALPLLALIAAGAPTAAFGQPNCRNTANFDQWLAEFKREAAAQKISPAAIAAASPYLKFEQRIINIDRGQRFFAQNFLDFSKKLIPAYRLAARRRS